MKSRARLVDQQLPLAKVEFDMENTRTHIDIVLQFLLLILNRTFVL